MKTVTFILALTLGATSASAFGLTMGNITPTLSFPSDSSDAETVTKGTISAGN